MGHAVIADQTSVRLSGETPTTEQTRIDVKRQIRQQADLSQLTSETHIGYAKEQADGTVLVDIFTEFQRPRRN